MTTTDLPTRFLCLPLLLMLAAPSPAWPDDANRNAHSPDQAPPAQPDLAAEISRAALLYQPLFWLGPDPPAQSENQALYQLIGQLRTRGAEETIPAIEKFLADHPDSPWAASLHANLGRYDYEHGLYTSALRHWEAAWSATRQESTDAGKKVADFTFAYWTRLLGSLGRVDQLRALFRETQGRVFDRGPLQQIVSTTQEGYRMMLSDPGVCFKCGTFALLNVARELKGPSFAAPAITQAPSPVSGFSISNLLAFSREAGLDLVAARWRDSHAELVTPSIIHWSQEHFAAVLKRQGGAYLVVDPTFGRPRWLAAGDIGAEASGYFLVPRASLPSDWKVVAAAEAATVFGRGFSMGIDSADDGCGNGSGGAGPAGAAGGGGPGLASLLSGSAGGSSACGSCSGGSGDGGAGSQDATPCCGDGAGAPGAQGGNAGVGGPSGPILIAGAGMPVWAVSEPYINVWIYDEPLGYQPGVGNRVSFRLAYKQRETRTGIGFFGFGPLWDCSCLSYVFLPTDSTTATLVVPGGGERTYTTDGTSMEFFSHTVATTSYASSNRLGCTISYANGAKDYYFYIPNLQVDDTPVAFLSAKVDPFGHATQFLYDEVDSRVKLRYVVDAEGRSTSITYTNGSFPTQITGVQDPFGRRATLQYDGLGALTNVIDTAGLSSSFAYNELGWVTNMVTPYGATVFQYFTNSTGNSGEFSVPWDPNDNPFLPIRAVRVIDPAQGTNIYMLRQDCSLVYTNPADYFTNWSNHLVFLPDNYTDPAVVPAIVPTSGLDTNAGALLYYRDTFHWGPRQVQGLPLDLTTFSPTDLIKARMRHWLHAGSYGGSGYISQILDIEQAPSPDGVNPGQTTWYDYDGKGSDPRFQGTNSLPSLIARVLPDGTTGYQWFQRDQWGRATNVVETFSTAFGATPETRTNMFIYDAAGNLVQQIGTRGETLAGYGYDANHQLLRLTNAAGDVASFAYGPQGRLTMTTNFTGLATTNIYPAGGPYSNWVQTTIDLQIGRTNTFTYTNDLVWTRLDERGNLTSNAWDNLQRLVSVSDGRGAIQYTYNKLDLSRVVDRLGFTTSYGHDAARRLVAATNALGYYTLYNYCSCGSLDWIQDAGGNFTQFFYNNAGWRTLTLYPDAGGYAVTNQFSLLGQVTNATDSGGYSVTNWFNHQGLRYAVQNAAGLADYLAFDDEDRVTNRFDANGVSVVSTYDPAGRTLSRAYPDGGAEHFGYSAAGLVAYTNQIGSSNFFGYDAAGRKTYETNANGEVLKYTNNAAGDLLSLTDGKNQTTTWHYDQFGRVTNKLDQVGAEILRYQYDAGDRLTNRWSAAKLNTGYTYDPVGNLTNIHYPSWGAIQFTYDAMNRLATMVDGLGATVYGYDAAGQLLTEDGPFASDTVTNTYSNRRRIALALQQPSSLWTNGFTYDTARRLRTVTSPAGTFTCNYTALDSSFAGSLVQELALPNGAYVTNTFDSVARLLITRLNNSGGSTLDGYAYVCDPANERTSLTRADSSTVAYGYDLIGQLKSAKSSPNTEDFGYTYDPAWNMTWRTNSGTNFANLTQYTYDLKNELARINSQYLNYDLNGNLVTNPVTALGYAYDDENRLVEVYHLPPGSPGGGGPLIPQPTGGWKSDFAYDGVGRMRVRRDYYSYGTPVSWYLTNTTEYVYDGNRVIQERDGNNTPTVSYTRGVDLSGSLEGAGGIGGLLARSTGYGSGWNSHSYYYADGNGNVTYLLDGSQAMVASYRYDPFGNTIAKSGALADANLYRFSSKPVHVYSGLYYYLYRFYDPNLQRWINQDPLGEPGNGLAVARNLSFHPTAPGADVYGFVGNEPVDFVDVDGRARHPRKYEPPSTPKIPKPRPQGPKTCFFTVVPGADAMYAFACTITVPSDPPDTVVIHPKNPAGFIKCMAEARQIWNNAFAVDPPNMAAARRACKRAMECYKENW